MKKNESVKNIIDYWEAVERFTPHKLDTESIFGNIESIQREVQGQHDIPWKNPERFLHKQIPNKTWVYSVFIGIINYSDITKLIRNMLEKDEENYNSSTKESLSCFCTFQLNNCGKIISNTFTIPEYFISMACLNQRKKHSKNWLNLAPKIHKKILDAYDNWVDVIQNRNDNSVSFVDIEELTNNIINVSAIE